MIENRPFLNFLTHLILIVGVVTVVFPVYLAFIAATHDRDQCHVSDRHPRGQEVRRRRYRQPSLGCDRAQARLIFQDFCSHLRA